MALLEQVVGDARADQSAAALMGVERSVDEVRERLDTLLTEPLVVAGEGVDSEQMQLRRALGVA